MDGDAARTAAGLLRAVERHLSDGAGDPQRLTGGDATAAAELTATAANVAALRIEELRLRYLGESSVAFPSETGAVGAARVVDVELTWRLAGHDPSASTLVVPVVLTGAGEELAFRTARWSGGRRVPLWLLAELAVRRTDTGIVAAADPQRLEELVALQERAAATVRSAVPGWTGQLVVEAPADQEQYAVSTGAASDDHGIPWAVAAMTTTADGRRSATSALRVHLHPSLFWGLGQRGRQVVTSHEAAHVALGTVLRPVPTWLGEGMADHIALRRTGIAVRDSAVEAIGMVRRDGLPEALPTDEQFAGSGAEAGAWYEAAWLAVRMLGDRYGETALLDFYRAAARDGATERAFEEVLDTTEAAAVAAWRAELAALARVDQVGVAG